MLPSLTLTAAMIDPSVWRRRRLARGAAVVDGPWTDVPARHRLPKTGPWPVALSAVMRGNAGMAGGSGWKS
jgi:hypothetical protein